jgi:hypothetical protein
MGLETQKCGFKRTREIFDINFPGTIKYKVKEGRGRVK